MNARITPQLSTIKCNILFWDTFLRKLQQDKHEIPGETETIIKDLASLSSRTIDPFPKRAISSTNSTRYTQLPNTHEADVKGWVMAIKLFVSLNCVTSCSTYFKRMSEYYEKQVEDEKCRISDNFISGAIQELNASFPPETEVDALLVDFFRFAFDVYTRRHLSHRTGRLDVHTFLTAAKRAGNVEFLQTESVLSRADIAFCVF